MHGSVEKTIETVRSGYPGDLIEAEVAQADEVMFTVGPEHIVDLCRFVVDNGWWHLSTITGRDTGQEIWLLYHFCADSQLGVTVKTALERDNPRIASITPAVPGAVLYEREVHEMFGVAFDGHPNLEPLMLPDDWPDGVYPLRLEEVQKRAQEENTNG